MLVIAKYQLGYKGEDIIGGQTFELDVRDYPRYINDVTVLPIPEIDYVPKVKQWTKESNKQLKSYKRKTK